MVVIFVSLSFKQHRYLKRIKDFKVLVEIRVATDDPINTLWAFRSSALSFSTLFPFPSQLPNKILQSSV